MRLKFPPSLHYPITLTELLVKPNDNVTQSEPLFSYFYKNTREVVDRDGNAEDVEENFPTRFASDVDGTLQKWMVQKGQVIAQPG